MLNRMLLTSALLLTCTLGAKAQYTLYMSKQSGDEFTWKKYKYEFTEDDYIRFEQNRFILQYADGTDKRSTYTAVDTFYLKDPGAALYKPSNLRSNDFHEESSKYCFQRSMSSDHFIVFWEAGFGLDPTKAESRYRFDPAEMLKQAEHVYEVNTQHLGFLAPGSVKPAQEYKIMMFVAYTTEWAAYGSGLDDKVGKLDVNIDAARDLSTCAHEIGHTFQYLIGCELGSGQHGWRYGFDASASGGCAWWEQCAQWQAYRCYPDEKFTDGWSSGVYSYSHLNCLHEEPRYSNYFMHDWWCHLHGEDFIGRLWQEAVKPEDPVETYMRMNEKSQDDFNADMYGYATHAITWDIDFIREAGRNRWDNFNTSMHYLGDKWLEVDSANCPQNYGFNILRLRNFKAGETIKAEFKGMAGTRGFRAIKVDKAGWRYGFVALLNDGSRVYGDMNSDKEGETEFAVPANASKVWFVVLGAPTEHWRHPWNMVNDKHTSASLADDEQWPYHVRFTGAEFGGTVTATSYDFPGDYERHDVTLEYDAEYDMQKDEMSPSQIDVNTYDICMALGINLNDYRSVNPTSEPENFHVCTILPDESDNTQLMSPYSYSWAFNADGTSSPAGLNDTDYAYYAIWSNYFGRVWLGCNKEYVEGGKTYPIVIAIRYTHTDNKTYTATIKVNITAK